MGLTNAEAQKQIRHLEGFIEQEAKEKIDEIDAKSEEESHLEKGRIIQHERQLIIEKYIKKEKAVEVANRIYISRISNQGRLTVLRAQDKHIANLIDDTRKQLFKIRNKEKKYKDILSKLVMQGLYRLMESQVKVRCREADFELLKIVLPKTVRTFSETLSMSIEVELDNEQFLPDDIAGGVEVYALRGKLKVPNTLETRLQSIAEELLPEIRQAIFGENIHRKYHD